MAASAASANENNGAVKIMRNGSGSMAWQAAINNISIKYEKHQWRNGSAKMAK
jgi:hypothetical protein